MQILCTWNIYTQLRKYYLKLFFEYLQRAGNQWGDTTRVWWRMATIATAAVTMKVATTIVISAAPTAMITLIEFQALTNFDSLLIHYKLMIISNFFYFTINCFEFLYCITVCIIYYNFISLSHLVVFVGKFILKN
jgi:hypothetical protein